MMQLKKWLEGGIISNSQLPPKELKRCCSEE